jgi:kynurenine formamidase
MVAGGKSLDDYALDAFCGPATIFTPGMVMSPHTGVIFRDQNIGAPLAGQIKEQRPKFVGLSSKFEFDVEIERDLLVVGIISFERLANTEQLPEQFNFYGMPLNIKGGDGSPVRAYAVVE